MSQILAFMALTIFSILAFWKENAVLFMVTAGIAIMAGLYAPDMLSSYKQLGISVGLGLIAYCFLCIGFALRLMFWEKEVE